MSHDTPSSSTELEHVSRADIMARRIHQERRLRIRRWRRTIAAPYIASSGTWVYGHCAHLAAALSGQPLTTAAITGAVAAGAVGATHAVLQKKTLDPRWTTRFWAAGATATTWSAFTAATGPSWLLTGTLAAATVGLGGRWWREHRLGTERYDEPTETPDDLEDIDTVAEPVSGATRIQERWDTYLAAKGKPFQGSMLRGEEELPTGWGFEVILDPDRNEYTDLVSKRGKIAAVMGVSVNDVQIESHPSLDNSRATLKVLVTNPLKDGVPYQGPRYDNGYIAVGPWRDGTGWGAVRIADHKATVMNGLVCGDPGAGKSVFLENLGMSALHSGRWMVAYCDGSEDGDSSTLLSNHMTVSTTGIKGAWSQLEAVQEYMAGRGLENAALPPDIRGVNPSPERLGLLWILDEFHRLTKADKAFASEVEQVVRLGRKKGVAVWTATQGLDLNLDFAGIPTLRDILTSRNVIAFYSSSKYAHNLINGPQLAPNTLPTDGGYAYLRAAGSSRAAMLRTDYSDDMSPWARALPALSLERDEIARLAVGQYIQDNQQSPEQAQGQARILLEQYKRARRLGMPSGTQPSAASAPRAISSATNSGGFGDLLGKMPAALTTNDLRVVTSEKAESKPAMKKEAILAELAKRGEASTGELAQALGFQASLVSTTMSRAVAKGEAFDLGRGKWGSPASVAARTS